MPGGLPRIPGCALVFQLGFAAHSMPWPWEKTPRQMSLELLSHAHRHIASMIYDNPGGDFSASLANSSKVWTSQHTNSS